MFLVGAMYDSCDEYSTTCYTDTCTGATTAMQNMDSRIYCIGVLIWLALVLSLLPGPAHRLDQVSLRDLLAAREVASGDLRVDLDA